MYYWTIIYQFIQLELKWQPKVRPVYCMDLRPWAMVLPTAALMLITIFLNFWLTNFCETNKCGNLTRGRPQILPHETWESKHEEHLVESPLSTTVHPANESDYWPTKPAVFNAQIVRRPTVLPNCVSCSFCTQQASCQSWAMLTSLVTTAAAAATDWHYLTHRCMV